MRRLHLLQKFYHRASFLQRMILFHGRQNRIVWAGFNQRPMLVK